MPMRYQKSRRNNYKRKSRSRLADKRVNTLVEKRMVEIAKKEDRKNQVYYVNAEAWPADLASANYSGVSIHGLNAILDDVDATGLTKNQNSLDYLCLTKLGQQYKNANQNPSVGPVANNSYDVDFKIKQCQAFISVYNNNVEPYQFCAALIGIPNANPITASSTNSTGGETNRLIPRRSMLCKNNWKFAKSCSGIFQGHFSNANKAFITDYHILDRKTVTLPGAGLAGSTGDANPKKVVHIKLNKVWKNPKKCTFKNTSGQTEPEQLQDYNIYLCMSTNASAVNSNIVAQAIGGVKFSCDGSPLPIVHAQTPL